MILLFGDRANSHKTAASHKNTNNHPVENSGILAMSFDSLSEARQALTMGQFDEYVSNNSNYDAAVMAFASSGISYSSEGTDTGFCGVSGFFAACGDGGFSAGFGGGESCCSSSSGSYSSVA